MVLSRSLIVHLAPFLASVVAINLPSVSIPLNDLASLHGKYIGTAYESYNVNNNTDFGRKYGAIAKSREFGMITPENSLKWETTELQPGVFNYTLSDALIKIAKDNGKRVRGHTLVWHSQLPAWVSSSNFTAPQLKDVLKRHVTNVASKYKGQLYAWDVVNEAFNEDGTFRPTIWYNTFGEDYIQWAFEWAHAADPFSKKYLNDYNFEGVSAKTDAAYALVKKLKAKGVPIHGYGAQAHFVLGTIPSTFQENLQRFANLGLEVALTEVDIRIDLPISDAKLKAQAADYTTTVNACLKVKGCVGITVWQFTDALSWIPGVFSTQGYALPWDADLKKKPAYDAIEKTLLTTWF